jgi:hypothetical protein
LVADAGDAQLEPIELVEARGDDGEDGQGFLKRSY